MEDEIYREKREEGDEFQKEEKEMMKNIMRMREIRVEEVMIKREEVEEVEIKKKMWEVMEIFEK